MFTRTTRNTSKHKSTTGHSILRYTETQTGRPTCHLMIIPWIYQSHEVLRRETIKNRRLFFEKTVKEGWLAQGNLAA